MPRKGLWGLLAAIGAAASLVVAAVAAGAVPSKAASDAAPAASAMRDVVLVGNSETGSVSFLDGHTFQHLGSFNVIPDLQERLAAMTPVEWAAYLVVRQQEGGDRFVDDAILSPDGRTLYVSRGNLADAAAFDLTTGQMLWRFKVGGHHADHAALSPHGSRFLVSATTVDQVQAVDTKTGTLAGSFGTGTYPHAIDYSADGQHIYSSSIGVISLPKALEAIKGQLLLTEVDANTLQVIRTWRFPHGIRPAVLTPDESTFYAQLSYLNGFVKYDLATGRIVATVNMPFSEHARSLRPDDYPRSSAHHGLAMSGDGAKLCDVGTIDDYTAVVRTSDLSTAGTFDYPANTLPYWATTSVDGNHCLVSLSNLNAVSVIDYSTAQEVAQIPVGHFPQRERLAKAPEDVLSSLSP